MRRGGVRRGAGFSLPEVLVAAGILGIAIIPVMSLFSSALIASARFARMTVMTAAATSFLEEARSLAFEDPVNPLFGPDAGEDPANRATFDDLDDLCAWSETPPRGPDGLPLDGMESVRLRARVWYVSDADADGSSDTNSPTSDDNGRILFTHSASAPAGACASPGAVTRFKALEVTTEWVGAQGPAPAPVVVRTIRFK